ncbi:MAG: nucleotide sugar dehydrogenase [Candidatus Rokubacteria bacterium]|nr:nucleotide sugar dehydrogenase [Candidatus Rokubacteria bacterium]
MKVSVFGAGYVGTVTAVCLASLGHRVFLVEMSPEKLELLCRGEAPVTEPGLADGLAREFTGGRLIPTDDAKQATLGSELALVCVGTPSGQSGSSDTAAICQVVREIAVAVALTSAPFVIALRSTIPSPQVEEEVLPILVDVLGPRVGRDVGFALNPEFLREGSAMADFMAPPFLVVGTEHAIAAKLMRDLYRRIEAPLHVVSPGTASLLKYASNAFHAVKVAFANEVVAVSPAFGADADQAMELFCRDQILNISTAYLRPGYAFGGPCLPKDLRALNRVASTHGASNTLLDAVLKSNEAVIRGSVETIVRLGIREVVLIGLSFKMQTDDLRESPYVELAERLLGKGFNLRVFDPDVNLGALRGRNLQYATQHLKHLTSLLCETPERAITRGSLVVLCKALLDATALVRLCAPGTLVLDLARALPAEIPPLRVVRLEGAGAREPHPR